MDDGSCRLEKGGLVRIAGWRTSVDFGDDVACDYSDGIGGATGQHSHYLLALIVRVNHDAGSVEDSRFAPISIFLKVEIPAHAIEGDIKLLEDAASDIACILTLRGLAGVEIGDHVVDFGVANPQRLDP